MREGARGVKRLMWAIYQNADNQTVRTLSQCLNYDLLQLRDDIDEIPNVTVSDEDEDDY